MNAKDITEPLTTLPENDGPAIPEGTTNEQFMLQRIIKEKAMDVNTFIATLELANIVPQGEKAPYDAMQLSMARQHLNKAFAHLALAVRG